MDKPVFEKITSVDKDDLEAALAIYSVAFPANERHPLAVIKERIAKGLNHVYIGRLQGQVAFMALLWPLKGTDFILLDYMATNPGHRGKNMATLFLKSMQDVLEREHKYFILEVEDPGHGDNKPEREKRVTFYKRTGAKILKDVQYILPALQGSEHTAMVLMIFPQYQDGKIEAGLVESLIVQIYKELYNRDEAEALRNTLLPKAGEHIELL